MGVWAPSSLLIVQPVSLASCLFNSVGGSPPKVLNKHEAKHCGDTIDNDDETQTLMSAPNANLFLGLRGQRSVVRVRALGFHECQLLTPSGVAQAKRLG